ncbi:winged helix DNA-binding domain-containing protein [Chitinimonas naiadis]
MAADLPVLSRRALNRAMLARQHLLAPCQQGVVELVEQLVGLQAQATNPPYIGLWTRLPDFQPCQLTDLLEARALVRATSLRGTLHLVSATDYLSLRPAMQPVIERGLQGAFGRQLEGADRSELLATGRALLAERAMNGSELAQALAPRWPRHDAKALAQYLHVLPLVQIPPSGTWDIHTPPRLALAEQWLAQPLSAAASVPSLLQRYLAAFGPASIKDMTAWCGLTGLARVVATLAPGWRTFQDDTGTVLYDLPDAPLPEPDQPVPARLLADFDNVLIAYANRERVVSVQDRLRVATPNGLFRATILVDGFVLGTWRLVRLTGLATVEISPFRPLTPSSKAELAAEAERFLRNFLPDIPRHTVEFNAALT